MRRIVAGLLMAGLAALAQPAAAQPRLRVEPADVDLGLVIRGEYREAEFVLHNDGTAPLVIREVETGCGCTVVSYDPRIPPGGSSVLRATVDSEKFSGELNRPIRISSNDAAGPALLNLRAVILGSVDFAPRELKLSNVGPTGSPEGVFVVRKDFSERGELAVSDVRVTVPWVEVRAERLTERRSFGGTIGPARPGDWLLHVRLRPTEVYGATRHEILFKTGLPREPEVVVPLWTVVRPPVNLSVGTLELVPDAAAATWTAELLATVRRDLDRADLVVESRPDDLVVLLEPAGPRHLRIRVSWTPHDVTGPGAIVFRIGAERVELPVVLRAGT